jgi:hypothetical protein
LEAVKRYLDFSGGGGAGPNNVLMITFFVGFFMKNEAIVGFCRGPEKRSELFVTLLGRPASKNELTFKCQSREANILKYI